jgi:hypothetical protein
MREPRVAIFLDCALFLTNRPFKSLQGPEHRFTLIFDAYIDGLELSIFGYGLNQESTGRAFVSLM